MVGIPETLRMALACPACREPVVARGAEFACCNSHTYRITRDSAVMLSADHPLRASYEDPRQQADSGWRARLRARVPVPDDRVWTKESRDALHRALTEARGRGSEALVVNLGSGIEKVFVAEFADLAIARVGLPHNGSVDVVGDVEILPLLDDSVDLFISSSVLEHVHNIDNGLAEIARIVKPGGLIYTELPFIRSFHMPPHDYRRYTLPGLEALHAAYGFDLVESGVCSGPFTAIALIVRDVGHTMLPAGALRAFGYIALSWIVHPLKYLDRLLGKKQAASVAACNFYYLGRKRCAETAEVPHVEKTVEQRG